jgi:hypothetical protein
MALGVITISFGNPCLFAPSAGVHIVLCLILDEKKANL